MPRRRAGARTAAVRARRRRRPEKLRKITPLIRERIKLLRDVLTVADFFFVDQLPPYDSAELIPKKGDAAHGAAASWKGLRSAGHRRVHARRPGSGAARGQRRTGHQSGTDVRAHPRGGLRPQDGAAAVRHAGSTGPRGLPGAHRARPSKNCERDYEYVQSHGAGRPALRISFATSFWTT